jgi:DnaJ-class molecular chaperone
MAKAKKEKESVRKEKVAQEEPVDDRSAYNCKACNGDGLENDYKKCGVCAGTGKV